MTKIKDIPVSDRPIERLIHNGASSLSLEELLTILINTGTRDLSSKMLAQQILSKLDKMEDIVELTLEDFLAIKGVGTHKAARILAALELGKRLSSKRKIIKYEQIITAEDVYQYYEPVFLNQNQENFYCLYLDSQKRVLESKLLFLGTLNFSMVHPREIFMEAYKHHATSIICVHNHPSGDVTPSKADIELTKRLIEIGQLMGIPIEDHVIVGKHLYYSFFEDGKME